MGVLDNSCSKYWETRYLFDRKSAKRLKNIGLKAKLLIIINTIIPFLFLYGKERNNYEMIERSLKFLREMPAEANKIIANWKDLGFDVNSAFESQALLQLKEENCDKRNCLNCHIGNYLLKCHV